MNDIGLGILIGFIIVCLGLMCVVAGVGLDQSIIKDDLKKYGRVKVGDLMLTPESINVPIGLMDPATAADIEKRLLKK
jgi:hypothetical protein